MVAPCIIVVNKWDAVDKDSHTIYDYDKQISARLNFLDWAKRIYVSAMTGQRVPKILDLVDQAVEEHRRRVTTSVVNEVLEDSVTWHSPPTTRQGRQGRIYYGTQVTTRPPSFTLFVNDPKLFKDNYRRYIERQFRENLGFEGTPHPHFLARQGHARCRACQRQPGHQGLAPPFAPDDMDLLRSLPIGLYLEQPVTWLHRLDPRVKMAWLVGILVTPILANAYWRFFFWWPC